MRTQKTKSGESQEALRWLDSDYPACPAPAGYYIAIRVTFAFPMVERNCLPDSWVREYTVSGLGVYDPAMIWAHQNQGTVRMSELAPRDGQGVLELAKYHGLHFGAAVCCNDSANGGGRSFGFFFRPDREFTAEELDGLHADVATLHRLHEKPKNLTDAERETLGLVKNGLLMKEIASALGVSESAVKQRLRNARVKLQAKTGSQAAARATMLGLI